MYARRSKSSDPPLELFIVDLKFCSDDQGKNTHYLVEVMTWAKAEETGFLTVPSESESERDPSLEAKFSDIEQGTVREEAMSQHDQ